MQIKTVKTETLPIEPAKIVTMEDICKDCLNTIDEIADGKHGTDWIVFNRATTEIPHWKEIKFQKLIDCFMTYIKKHDLENRIAFRAKQDLHTIYISQLITDPETSKEEVPVAEPDDEEETE